jgi:hypothetical protein
LISLADSKFCEAVEELKQDDLATPDRKALAITPLLRSLHTNGFSPTGIFSSLFSPATGSLSSLKHEVYSDEIISTNPLGYFSQPTFSSTKRTSILFPYSGSLPDDPRDRELSVNCRRPLCCKHVLMRSRAHKVVAATRRTWAKLFAVLRGSVLILYASAEEVETGSPQCIVSASRPTPAHAGLEHCLAQPIADNSKRDFVFSLAVANGNVFHFQASSVGRAGSERSPHRKQTPTSGCASSTSPRQSGRRAAPT